MEIEINDDKLVERMDKVIEQLQSHTLACNCPSVFEKQIAILERINTAIDDLIATFEGSNEA